MPRNDYECSRCGVHEVYFVGEPPRRCRCGRRLRLVVCAGQFSLGGGMQYLTEREKDSIAMQLGVRPESADHLRRIEKEKQVTAISKSEFFRTERESWSKKELKVSMP